MERFLCLSFLTAGLVSSAPTKPPSTRSTRNMNQFYGNPHVDSNSIQDQYQGPLFQQMIYKGLTPQDIYSNQQNYGQQFPHHYQQQQQNPFLPQPPKMSYQIIRHEHGDGKGIFDFVGDWIQQTGWFPIEVNIPDAFSNLGQGFQQFGNNVGGWFQGIGSNLPFFGGNNASPTSLPPQPPGGRPSNRYYVLVPAAGGNLRNNLRNTPIKRVSVTPEGFFNPFGAFFDNSGSFPPYP